MVESGVVVAAPKDVTELCRAFQLPHVRAFVTPMSETEIEEAIGSPDDLLLIGRANREQLSAFAHLHGLRNPHRSIELRRFAVADVGKGHGGRFLPSVIREVFAAYQAQRFWLDVFPENDRARSLYRHAGFVEEGTLRNAYIWNGHPQSTIVMSILREEQEAAMNTAAT